MSVRQSPLMNNRIKVTTYNVLSSHLAGANHFTHCKPEYLDAKYRLEKLKSKLEKEIADQSVVCLQEISQNWAANLHTFFASRGYHLITGLYGKKFNGYMGVAIAVPLAKYNIESVDITRIADTKRMPYKPRPVYSFVGQIYQTIYRSLLKWAEYFRFYSPPIDVWDSALWRMNIMVCTRLSLKNTTTTTTTETVENTAVVTNTSTKRNQSFVVGTYHMPCMFKLPSVMVTHCALSAQHIQKYAGHDPYIYVGDFNIKPQSSQYELLTKGQLDRQHPDYPPIVPDDNWTPRLSEPLQSAYVTKTGHEPDFTNYAQVQDEPVFIETLDYLFHSPQWEVVEVEELPPRGDVAGPLPNAEEPSDHILLSATFQLPAQE